MHMKAVYVQRPYEVVVKEVAEPVLKPDEVRMKVKSAGICGSDLHTYKGIHPFRKPPVIIGHEVCGEVIEVGSEVTRVKPGDKVTVEPQDGCGKCEHCLRGETNYCPDRAAPGIADWYGTMAEYFHAPEHCVFVLPEEMSFEEGTLVEPLAVGVHAVRKADIQVGDRVAVLGAGPIGLLSLAAAKAAGATTVLVTDVLDYALESAAQMGADLTLNVDAKQQWVDEAQQLAGGAFDKVLVAVGIPGIINQALSLLKKGGRAVAVAMFHEEQALDIMQLQGQEKEIVGSFTYTRTDTQIAVDLLTSGQVNSKVLITHVLPYEEAAQGFKLVDRKEDRSLKVLVKF